MKSDTLLSRCTKVRARGRGQWIACCPAHDDKTPSMVVRELDDGRVLVHCFGGCGVEEILQSVGLTFDALFPDKLIAEHLPGLRHPFPAADVLEALCGEMDVMWVCAGDLTAGKALSEADTARLGIARERIERAIELALGKR